VLLHEGNFMGREGANLPQFRDHNTPHGTEARAWRRLIRLLCLPGACQAFAVIDSFDGIREIAHEIRAAKLTISEDSETKFLLLREDAKDRLVFEFTKAGVVWGTFEASFDKILRPQKTADVIGSVWEAHSGSPSARSESGR